MAFLNIGNMRRSIGRVIAGESARTGARGRSLDNTVPQQITVEQALRCHTVFACVTQTARGISEVEFTAPKHKDLNAILKTPNAWQTRSEYLHSLVMDRLLYGDAYTRVVGGVNNPSMFAPENPLEIAVAVDGSRKPTYSRQGSNALIRASSMLRFRDVGTHSIDTITRIDALAIRIWALIEADMLMTDTFKNGVHAQYVAKFLQMLDEPKYEQVIERITEAIGRNTDSPRSRGRGSVVVMEGGGELVPIKGLTPADADLRELRNDLKMEIAAGFDVPPFLVGAPGDTKYNNVSARVTAMYRGAFSPLITDIKNVLEHKFDTEIKVNDAMLQRGDFASQIVAAIGLVSNGIYTPNEARVKILDGEKSKDENADKLRVSSSGTDGQADRRGEMPSDTGSDDGPEEE